MKISHFIKEKKLESWLEKISKGFIIYLPVQDKKRNIIDFMKWENSIGEEKSKEGNKNNNRYEINLSEKTKKSPKHIFSPPTENLFEFEYKKDIEKPDIVNIDLKTPLSIKDISNDSNKKEIDSDRKIIFGIKPCDILAVKRMDKFFKKGDYKDPYYIKRRKGSIFISIGCDNPYPDCFCKLVGGHPFNFEYADIGMVKVDDGYAVIKLSDRVKWLIKEYNEFFEKEDLFDKYQDKIDEIISNSVKKISTSNYLSDISIEKIHFTMEKAFNLDIWKEITRNCISCAACTYVCPTCFCFSIGDEQRDLKGERYRAWDYCMNYYYNLEASGHNPRANIYQRYRNKANCKYNYNFKRYGNIFCVGCGRCIEVCPVGIDIREVVDTVLKNI